MQTEHGWNWEAALVPCWGWYRNIPIAKGLAFLFPGVALLLMYVLTPGHIIESIQVVAIALFLYVVLYGALGNWMLRQAGQSGDGATAPVGGTVRHAVASLVAFAACGAASVAGLSLYEQTRPPVRRAFVAEMKGDLRNFVTAQEAYFSDSGRYAPSMDTPGLLFKSSPGVTVSIIHADSVSWAAAASHAETATRCTMFAGPWENAPAGVEEGEPVCEANGVPR